MFSVVIFVLNKTEPTDIITVVIKVYNLWLETLLTGSPIYSFVYEVVVVIYAHSVSHPFIIRINLGSKYTTLFSMAW